MDIVFIENLKIKTTIGVWEWEQRIKQNLLVDVQLGVDIKPAAQSDCIEKAISYKQVAKRVSETLDKSNFKLVETVAEHICTLILNEFPVEWCQVKVSKPRAVENADSVGVIIERFRENRNETKDVIYQF